MRGWGIKGVIGVGFQGGGWGESESESESSCVGGGFGDCDDGALVTVSGS